MTLKLLAVFPHPDDEMHEDAAVAVLAMQGRFYRAFSLVSGARQIETDLLDGIR